ncbi:hypothetical protein [uncultured Roseobacter sp.]|uniref:hypothetical protein n=1 Tax=uncultured Roseobacter sp. TaxID=114847 RepID=UPI00262BA55A|nr:hypothetical protein [uncultured Roseobacter sp.]
MRVGFWTVVKSAAELQILTRASYLMLLLVPVMAGVWTTVEGLLPTGNFAAHPLPTSWVLIYFAAVFAVLGQLIYQARVPYLIQRFSESEYLDVCRNEWQKSPNNEVLAAAAGRAGLTHSDRLALRDRVGAHVFDSFYHFSDEGAKKEFHDSVKNNQSFGLGTPNETQHKNFTPTDEMTLISKIVRHSAIKDYQVYNCRNRFSSIFSLMLYFVAIILILYVGFEQTKNVLLAAHIELFK